MVSTTIRRACSASSPWPAPAVASDSATSARKAGPQLMTAMAGSRSVLVHRQDQRGAPEQLEQLALGAGARVTDHARRYSTGRLGISRSTGRSG